MPAQNAGLVSVWGFGFGFVQEACSSSWPGTMEVNSKEDHGSDILTLRELSRRFEKWASPVLDRSIEVA